MNEGKQVVCSHIREKTISQEFQLHIGVEEEPAQILEQDREIPELSLVLWENQSANGFGRTEATAGNYRTAHCNDLNTGLKHQGQQKPRGNTYRRLCEGSYKVGNGCSQRRKGKN